MKIKCPKCGFVETDEEKFIDTTVPCEDCGEHSGIQCPRCDELYDHVWKGDVCTECGLIIDVFGECPHHPNAKRVSWLFGLHRGK